MHYSRYSMILSINASACSLLIVCRN